MLYTEMYIFQRPGSRGEWRSLIWNEQNKNNPINDIQQLQGSKKIVSGTPSFTC